MYRYAQHAQARADELLELIDPEQLALLKSWAETPGNVDFDVILDGPSVRVRKLLSQTPAKDRAWAAKKDRGLFLREWLDARYWALKSSNVLRLAAKAEDVKGLGYRQATVQGALISRHNQAQFSLDDLLGHEWDGL